MKASRDLTLAAGLLLAATVAASAQTAPTVEATETAAIETAAIETAATGPAVTVAAAGTAATGPATSVAGREPASIRTELAPLTVEAARAPAALADPSASVTSIGGEALRRSAARGLDDALRRVPGFSLFRRLGSSAAHPTTQGVSLRGIGPTGTSRALVLVDGVPVNDPFGGWVYWSRIPTETVERVDVLRGSGASLWGNYAMGGVLDVLTRDPSARGAALVTEAGERGGARTEGWTSGSLGRTSALVDGRWMRSGDFPLIRKDTRGSIDVPGGSENVTGGLRLEHDLSPDSRLRLAMRAFRESRDNGTPYTSNETASGFLRSGFDVETSSFGSFAVDLFGTLQSFSSTFSSVAPDRDSELPAADQFAVPSSSVGGSVVWTRELGGADDWTGLHRLVGGLDALWVTGESRELFRFMAADFTRMREGGASQVSSGIFLEDLVRLGRRVDLTAALRLDHWESFDGFRREEDLSTGALLVDRALEDSTETLVSPRLGLAWQAPAGFDLRSAVYRGFRAPTINELVRPFRVRSDITEANDALDAEKLFGAEGGFDRRDGRWRSSATLFWNQIEDPVFNVTVGEGPGLVDPCGFVPAGGVCRQRRNLGRTRILGVEADVGVELGRGWEASVSYLWSDGEIRSAADEPALVGNRIPQVPRHQGAFGLDYDDGGPWRASLQLRLVGEQFDDDANTRRLDRFVAVDAYVSRELGLGFELFAAAENLFDETIEAGRSADDVVAVGPPRLLHAGLRYTPE